MRLSRLALVLPVLGTACRAPTQITFDITTNVDCAQLTDTAFTSGPLVALGDGRPASAVAHGCASTGSIGSVVVVPSGSSGALVAVKVVTGVGVEPDQCGPTTKCIVAKRALNFIPNTPLLVHIDMSTLCEGVVCDGDQTCENGQCVSAIIGDPSQCEGAGCGGNVLTPVDGGTQARDGGADSGLDATLPGDASGDAGGPADASTDTAPPLDAPAVPAIGLGYSASCALMPGGSVNCWGANGLGELGSDAGSDAYAFVPQPVPGLANVVSLAVGTAHSCAVLRGGDVACWGYGGAGALGRGTSLNQNVPAVIDGLAAMDGGSLGLVVAGKNHTCAVAKDGVTLWCWGYYALGPEPPTSTNNSSVPVYLATLDAGVVEMAAGNALTCARAADGSVRCWGVNTQGGLGQGDGFPLTAWTNTPVVVPIGAPAVQLAVAGSHACVVTAAHDLVCWGDDSLNQFGALTIPDGGNYLSTPSPVQAGANSGHFAKVGCGDFHTCALFDDGGIQCWGYNFDGELGIPAPPDVELTPQAVPDLGAATDLTAHYQSACATLTLGGVACWGNDLNGQLGAGAAAAGADAGEPVGALPLAFP